MPKVRLLYGPSGPIVCKVKWVKIDNFWFMTKKLLAKTHTVPKNSRFFAHFSLLAWANREKNTNFQLSTKNCTFFWNFLHRFHIWIYVPHFFPLLGQKPVCTIFVFFNCFFVFFSFFSNAQNWPKYQKVRLLLCPSGPIVCKVKVGKALIGRRSHEAGAAKKAGVWGRSAPAIQYTSNYFTRL